MRRKLIMCPETSHVEEIEYVTTPLGMLVASCSRFPGKLACTRDCAARADACERAGRTAPDPVKFLAQHGAVIATDEADE